ncbi:MAG: hypothetical protein BHV71_04245 [Bacteroides sp. 41_26]|nr:MAG: hypothetical protein BHV71_04245 [Bacteroides sp. 41_26]
METITNSFPQQRVMIGRVVSIVVAPPAEMGARRPKYLTNNGAQSRAIISRMMFDKSAIVPNSGPLYSVIKMLESE